MITFVEESVRVKIVPMDLSAPGKTLLSSHTYINSPILNGSFFRYGCIRTISCSVTKYCPYLGQKCERGICVFPQCKTNGDCPDGKVCFNGICENKVCIPEECFGCYKRPCHGICENNICVWNARCNSIADCSDGQDCIPDKKLGYNVCKPEVCKDDVDCTSPFKCTKMENGVSICMYSIISEIRCSDTVKCPAGYVCLRKNCVPDCTSCKTGKCKVIAGTEFCDGGIKCKPNERCPNNQVCEDGVCKVITCVVHEECPLSQLCMFGQCIDTKIFTRCPKTQVCSYGQECVGDLCTTYKLCASDDDCGPNMKCDVTFLKNGYRGICIPKITCDYQNNNEVNYCPVNMECEGDGFCKSSECSQNDCHYKQSCRGLMNTFYFKVCFPTFECNHDNDCGWNQVCNPHFRTCLNTCPNCLQEEKCQNGFCRTFPICNDRKPCPPRQICKNGRCEADLGDCFTKAECPSDSVCVGGVCTKTCSQEPCTLGDCHKILKVCLTDCKGPCKRDYYCEPITQTCLPIMPCQDDFNCPDDMVCLNGKLKCNGENTCKCAPQQECEKCMAGSCIKNTKLCPITTPVCENCGEKSICPKFKVKKYENCIPKCNPYLQNDCENGYACIMDRNKVAVCIGRLYCRSDMECEYPMICQNSWCTPPDCYQNDECPDGEYCYRGKCNRNKETFCTNNGECPKGDCQMSGNLPLGFCLNCPVNCFTCKSGLCDYPTRCLENHHCGPYEKCEKETCVSRKCDDCNEGDIY